MDCIRIFGVSFHKQMRDFLHYPNYILKSFFYTPVSYILPFYFLMKASIGSGSQDQIFQILLCIVLWQYIEFSVVETCNISNRELNIGTIEMIYTLPISKTAWILGSSCMSSALFACSNIVIIYLLKILLHADIALSAVQILGLLFLVFIQTCFFSLDVFVLNIKFKKIFNTLLLLLNMMYILSGVIYPVRQLPTVLQYISFLLPFTGIFKLIRGETFSQFEWVAFIAVNVVYAAASLILYKIIQKDMKKNGDFSMY